MVTLLETIAIILLTIHFGVPLAYYYYAKTRWLPRPWNLKLDPNYQPKVTIIIPTYNESNLIKAKLDNIYAQNYTKDKIEVIVVDSASNDGTPSIVKQWAESHQDLNLKLIQEPVRKGMAHALHTGFYYAEGDIIVVTDADAIWDSPDTLQNVVAWLSHESVGAVSCIKNSYGNKIIEKTYRKHYNVLRIAESKMWSTPIFHGELAAFTKDLLAKVGGFPLGVGSAESLAAMKIVAIGYRAIIPDTIVVNELIPQDSYIHWRIRRAQHLILHFVKTLGYLKYYNNLFKRIVMLEAFLHIVNPWLLIVGGFLLLYASILKLSGLAWILIILGIAFLSLKIYRTWIMNQLFLLFAQLRNLWHKELVWTKQRKYRG